MYSPGAVQHPSSPSIDLTPPAVTRSQYFMNDIPRGTSQIKLVNYLLAPPHWTRQPTRHLGMLHPQVQFACTITDSRLDDELSVATIEFTHTPEWLNLLNDDPTGFPKKTLLGTLWRGVDTEIRDSDGRTEFMRAAMADDLLYAEALAEFTSTDINVQDDQGRTALHWASANRLPSIVMLCLSVPGCDIGLRDHDNLTAFDLSLSAKDEVIPNLFYHSMFVLEEHDPQAALLRVLTVSSAPGIDKPVFPGTAMFGPAQDGNSALVEALITRGVDLTATNTDGETALHLAAAKVGNADVVRRLLQAGADIDAAAPGGATALSHAADEETVQALRQWKADLAASGTSVIKTPSSAVNGNGTDIQPTISLPKETTSLPKEIISLPKEIISLPKAIETRDDKGRTTLHYRAQAGDLDAVLDLIKGGSNLEAIDNDGCSALHLAVDSGRAETVTALLTNGVDIDATTKGGCTALHYAALKGHAQIATSLLTNNANTEATVDGGWTALHYAVVNRHPETVTALLTNGVDTAAATNDGRTALHYSAHNGNSEIVAALLTHGADMEAAANDGCTALHFATQNGHAEIVTTLLTNGANTTAKTDAGLTALHYAVVGGQTGALTALLTNGVDTEAATNDGWTALHMATQNGLTATVNVLLENGAKLETKGDDKETALHKAAGRGNIAEVGILLDHGARIEARSRNGTPLQMALSRGHNEVAAMLVARGARTTTTSRLRYSMLSQLGLRD